jgi:hypothetical protein
VGDRKSGTDDVAITSRNNWVGQDRLELSANGLRVTTRTAAATKDQENKVRENPEQPASPRAWGKKGGHGANVSGDDANLTHAIRKATDAEQWDLARALLDERKRLREERAGVPSLAAARAKRERKR